MEIELLKELPLTRYIQWQINYSGNTCYRYDILDLLSAGITPGDMIKDFPFLGKDDIRVALLYAFLRLKNTLIMNAA